jgi:hypothetical protein
MMPNTQVKAGWMRCLVANQASYPAHFWRVHSCSVASSG